MIGAESSGREQTSSALRPKMCVLGVDLGGTKLSAAIVQDNKVVSTVRQIPTPSGADNIVDGIIDLISDFQKDYLLSAVGIATAGIVNSDTGEIIGSTGNLPGWEGTPVKTIIERRTMLPCHVENDANAAAYGECHFASYHEKPCVIVVTLGTGIGGGIVLFGKLYRGAHFAAGEIGHIKISMDNRRMCTCGLWDCWEAYGSGTGLAATGREIVSALTPAQSELAKLKDAITTQAIIDAKAAGDIIAEKIMNTWHEHVVAGLVSLAHAFDPNCFFISGGMSQFVNYELLRELFIDRTLPRIGEEVQILPSSLGTQAGMIGAAGLALDSIVINAG